MINLKNTYVQNVKGELADLYVAEAKKQGFVFQSNSAIGDGWKYLFCFSKGIYTSNCVTTEKELTVDDFKLKITIKEFLAKGYKFVAGDSFINEDGTVIKIKTNSHALSASSPYSGDDIKFVISAKALDNPTEQQVNGVINGKVYHKALTCGEIVKIGAEQEITMELEEDKMKRTVVTYEKVNKSNCSIESLMQELINGALFYDNKHSGGHYPTITVLNKFISGSESLYRKVTKEITPMQAAKNACKEFLNVSATDIDAGSDFDNFLSASNSDNCKDWDSEFIDCCRAIVKAYDGK